MKGLLKKDAYVLSKNMKMFLLMIFIFTVLPGMNMSIFAIVYCGMLPYNAMAYDERCHWDDLAAMMPYTTGDIVLSKYVLGWVAVTLATALSLAVKYLLSIFIPSAYVMSLAAVLPSLCIGLLMIAVMLPPLFRFGVEKARTLSILMVVVLAAGGAGLAQGVMSATAGSVSPILTAAVTLGFPVVAVLLTAASVPLSIAFYNRRKVKA